jgi:group I intron endonuclease
MNSKMTIYKGILKYGYTNFRLDILEYCTPNVLLEREQYYIDLIKPKYNNLRIAGSSIGYKHTIDTLKKFSTRKVSEITRANLAKAATDRVLTDAARAKISLARTGIKLSDTTKAKLSAIASAKTGIEVKVMNITTGNTTEYLNLTLAALALGVSRTAISKALVKGNLIKKTYLITRT